MPQPASAPPVPSFTPPEPPIPPPAPEPTPPVPPASTAQPTAATPPAVEEENARTKRVIQPLAPGTAPVPTDLNELMAKEGHALNAVQPPQPVLPHQPGHVISPNPVNATGQPEDPNKISL